MALVVANVLLAIWKVAAYVPLCRIGEPAATGVDENEAYLIRGDEGGEDGFEEERERLDATLDSVLEL